MSEKKRNLELDCESILNKKPLVELRAYGRYVGVENPTEKKKAELIEAIVSVLVGDTPPVSRATRGAPVKVDYFDPELEKEIQQSFFIHGYDPSAQDVEEPDLGDTMRTVAKVLGGHKKNTLIVRSSTPIPSALDQFKKEVFKGQLETLGGVACLVPLNGDLSQDKIVVSVDLIQQHGLREGDTVTCYASRNNAVLMATEILTVNHLGVSSMKRRVFEETPVCQPKQKIEFTDAESVEGKYLNWLIPLGEGQRCLISSPPKAGKTTFLKAIAEGLVENDRYDLLVLLVEQSPETVSAFRKLLPAERLMATTYEDDAEMHVFAAEFLLKRAKRLTEAGRNVVLLVDGTANLAEAYNELQPSGGKTVAGLESNTLRYMKKFFGSARCLEEGGSLTLVATVLHSSGNPAADRIASELSALANSNIRLSEKLAIKRAYPAVDLAASATDGSPCLLGEERAKGEYRVRNGLLPALGNERLQILLSGSASWDEFLAKAEKQVK